METQIQKRLWDTLADIAAISIGPMTLGTLFASAVAFIICFILIRVLTGFAHRVFFKEKHMGDTLGGALESIVKVGLWVVTAIIIAHILGIPTASIVAGVGVVGLALSLSIQNIMSNIFSGITLLMTKPFSAGDYVDIAGKTGTVKNVGLFYTVLNTLDNVRVSIPNGDVTAAAITNYSAESIRRVEQFFSASYDAPTETVRAALLEAARGDVRILNVPPPSAAVREYGESSIEYVTRVWCDSKDYWDVLYDMNERVRESFARHGVEMTYNHLNVHMDR